MEAGKDAELIKEISLGKKSVAMCYLKKESEVHGYEWKTSSRDAGSDPVAWKFEMKTNEGWALLDKRCKMHSSIPLKRNTPSPRFH